MKKVLEEEITAKSNYATIAGIRVGESSEAKASFWPEVLENTEKTDTNEIRSTAEGIQEATGWECPVDKNSVHALCQLHEVYVDEKRRRSARMMRLDHRRHRKAGTPEVREKKRRFWHSNSPRTSNNKRA